MRKAHAQKDDNDGQEAACCGVEHTGNDTRNHACKTHAQEDDDSGQQLHDVGHVVAVERLLQRSQLVIARE